MYSSQGVTIDGDTFTLYSAGMDRANTYVALSRHKDCSHVYINRAEVDERIGAKDLGQEVTNKERTEMLAKLMSRDNQSSLAIENLPKQKLEQQISKELEIID